MSTILHTGDSWPDFDGIKHLVVFGDSFSAVEYNSKERHPSAEHPIGIDFPGLTSCECVDQATQDVSYEPNWVGHLVKTVNANRKSAPLLVYDFAVSGDTIARMRLWQLTKEFLPHLGSRPEWARWSPTDTLFITWIGINDCTWNVRLQPSSIQACFDDLFATQEILYGVGARNFCLIDIPPVHTFPGGAKTPRAKAAYESWNPLLRQGAEKFSAAHPDTTVLLFSSWDVFTRTLSHPGGAGFPRGDSLDRETLFVDGFHPSSEMHAVLAKEILQFLAGVSAHSAVAAQQSENVGWRIVN